ncbi:hypothetical protein DP116_11615 [Brasilonema bromeliae SPC951]|uniref:Uncharacterized protein n=1 Tax=Brasilonema bromeliae SPC951 TaxID=385972 RepID=A0ABX1P6Q2_9CYAN|nr:hypothetical protein [Brasilonema bromeliae SPC951]
MHCQDFVNIVHCKTDKKVSQTFKTVTLSNFLVLIVVYVKVFFANLLLTLPMETTYLQKPIITVGSFLLLQQKETLPYLPQALFWN